MLGAARGDPGGPRHFGTGCDTFSAGTPPGHAPGLRGGLLRFATLLSLLSERTASEGASVRTALGHFDEELFAEIREKKLATLLCREIVETEPSWLKWDFEEAQTKIDIGDMVLEALVTETIEFLNTKNPKSQAQVNFEEI